MTVKQVHYPTLRTDNGDFLRTEDTDSYPCLMTSGCCEDVLYDGDTQRWVEEFKKRGITYSVYASQMDRASWNGTTHTKVEKWDPYPLDDQEAAWVDEDSVSFHDPSAGWINLATTCFYKGRKYLAPWVEYNPEYNGLTDDDINSNDVEALRRNIDLQRQYAVKHRDLISAAIEAEGLDGFVEYYDDQPESVFFESFSGGFRVGIDLQQAMKHFGTFEKYKAWWTAICTTYTIEELMV